MKLDQLQRGEECFVEMWGSDVYPATVTTQFWNEQSVQVRTPAATHVYRPWHHMSFRWKDGRGCAADYARILVPQTDDELTELEARAKKTACPFSDKLGLDVER